MKVIKVVVTDSSGYGVPRVRVNRYDGKDQYTNSDGEVVVLIPGDSTSIYVDGFTVFDGYTCDCPQVITHQQS